MIKPKISIIVPAYNAEDYIERCLDSLIKQSLDRFEVIVVDDGSTDKTNSIVKSYVKEYKNFVSLVKTENGGPSRARNIGMNNAVGEYIAFLDADDYADRTMYEKMYEHALKNDCDLVVVGFNFVFGNEVNGKYKENYLEPYLYQKSIFQKPWLLSSTSPFVWDKLFKRRIILENQLEFNESLGYSEDTEFLTRYKFYANKIGLVNEHLHYYGVKQNNSITGKLNEKQLDIVRGLGSIMDFYIEKGEFNTFKKQLFYIAAGFYTRRLSDFQKFDNKKLQIRIINEFHIFFNTYFYDWKDRIIEFKCKSKIKRVMAEYRRNKSLANLYIYTPNIIKNIISILFHLPSFLKIFSKKVIALPVRLTKTFKDLFNRIKNTFNNVIHSRDRILYAYFRKYCKIDETKVFAISYYGANISGNPYYMAKEFLKDSKYKVYMGSNSIGRDMIFAHYNNFKAELVKIGSIKYIYLLATTKYLIINSRVPEYFIKRFEQKYINTWHGTPLKTLGKKMLANLKDVGNNQNQFLMADYLIYPNKFTKSRIMEDFCLDETFTKKVSIIGYPRNSIFFNSNESNQRIRKTLKLEDKKVYVYMPTWRGSSINAASVLEYKNEIEILFKEIDKKLDDKSVMYVKLHSVVMNKIPLDKYKHIKPFHPHIEPYEFLNMADCLITDYSSVFFDFACSRKEIILLLYDFDKYNKERGTYMSIKNLPFKKFYSVDTMVQYMNQYNEFVVTPQYEKFIQKYCPFDSESTSEDVCQMLIKDQINSNMEVYNFENNAENSFELVIMPNINSINDKVRLMKMAKEKKNRYFVFRQDSFNEKTNKVLIENEKYLKYFIVPKGMVLTIGEALKLIAYRKVRLFKRNAKKVYEKEAQRIFPNIKIENIINLTKSKKYNEMAKLLINKDIRKEKEVFINESSINIWDV